MYWPVGAPRIYEQRLATDPTHNSLNSRTSLSSALHGKKDGTRHKRDLSETGTRRAQTHAQGSSRGANDKRDDGFLVATTVSRSGHIFATITKSTLTVWQTEPTVILASVTRSANSLVTYGTNRGLMLRPDAAILVLSTELGYLITYSLAGDPGSRVYELLFLEGARRHSRKRSVNHSNGYGPREKAPLTEGGGRVNEASLRFRMVIRLDAGISQALALDDELVIATQDPAAIQCIRWTPDRTGSQTVSELLSRMAWYKSDEPFLDLQYDRPMNLFTWTSADGRAFTVQRLAGSMRDSPDSRQMFKGYVFHEPHNPEQKALRTAINSRFSLIAVGCQDGTVWIYKVRDYTGGVVLRQTLQMPASPTSTGSITSLVYSPDGYCLFGGYENGWVTWSVYGHPGASSFTYNETSPEPNKEKWLSGILDSFWVGGGSDLALIGFDSRELWILEFARSAITGCFNPSNVSKALLQTNSALMIYQGHDTPDLTTISADVSLWHHVQVPSQYLMEQWPIRSAVISPDGRYLAIAGQRGLAHYSVHSGRWKTFEDPAMQNDFFVRGGMCWHHHALIAAVESTTSAELRVYSREAPLENSKALFVETLTSPIVHMTPSGSDSLLVYSYENTLDHYIIVTSSKKVKLVRVGQIALNGIIRAPPRVRSVSWIVPDEQLGSGDPSQDVATASVIFLIDGKLVLLQPSSTGAGELKYDMRVIAQQVEYYLLARDHPTVDLVQMSDSLRNDGFEEYTDDDMSKGGMQDSLWLFDGSRVRMWHSVKDLLNNTNMDPSQTQESSIDIPVDFYPLSALLHKGILFGIEAELSQKRDTDFAYFRPLARTTLFLPSSLRYHLSLGDTTAAQNLALNYQHLPYFAHALEILLHNVLDEEFESPSGSDASLLPTVLSFLSLFPENLEIIVQCTRKTELRSWRTLFAHLPPPGELFERSLQNGNLKTAGGYLLVLHTLAGINSTSPQVVRLLRAAKEQQDWELCKELARFLMALDDSGATLKEALDLSSPSSGRLLDPLDVGYTNGLDALHIANSPTAS